MPNPYSQHPSFVFLLIYRLICAISALIIISTGGVVQCALSATLFLFAIAIGDRIFRSMVDDEMAQERKMQEEQERIAFEKIFPQRKRNRGGFYFTA